MTDNTTNDVPAQIPKHLVGQNIGRVGDNTTPEIHDEPVRYYNLAANRRALDVHRALLIDSENPDRLLYAWTNEQKRTWKVEQVGTDIRISDIELESPDDYADKREYVEDWVSIVINELRHDVANQNVSRSISDEIRFVGSQTLEFRDHDGRETTFQIALE